MPSPIRHDNVYKRHFKPAVKRRYYTECDTDAKATRKTARMRSADLVYVLPPAKHGLRFYGLRHNCTAMLITQGAHTKAIQDHLGHIRPRRAGCFA
ncbi:MAG: hypothetical protein JST31_00450 [Actinobacteria bacterium]|nr:hypothetical protein [Actinomycetota bacterium]